MKQLGLRDGYIKCVDQSFVSNGGYIWLGFTFQPYQILIVKNIFVCDEPLEYSGLSLGINSQADSFFHGTINDCLCDAALLTTGSFLLCFGSLTIFC